MTCNFFNYFTALQRSLKMIIFCKIFEMFNFIQYATIYGITVRNNFQKIIINSQRDQRLIIV